MNTENTTKSGGQTNTPLQIFQPMNIVVFLSFFSPIILATSVTSTSFLFQNFKGLIYLGFLVGCCFARSYIYMISGAQSIVNDQTICTSVQYSKYGNPSFSSFVFAFTIVYLFYPMFVNGNINFWIFSLVIVYFFTDMFIKLHKKCIVKISDLVLNVLLGATSSAFIIALMYTGGSGKYLFFNETTSNSDVCYQPSKQTFKCQMYKDGTLISEL